MNKKPPQNKSWKICTRCSYTYTGASYAIRWFVGDQEVTNWACEDCSLETAKVSPSRHDDKDARY